MLSCSQLLWHLFSPALVKRQIVHVSSPDFLFGGGRRQHDLQEANGKGEGRKNRSWFYGGKCSGIRAVQGFDKSLHEPLSFCNAGKQAVTIYPKQMNGSCVILPWTTLNYCAQIHNVHLSKVHLSAVAEAWEAFLLGLSKGCRHSQ